MIEGDEYDLYLKAILFNTAESLDRYTPQLAAEHLWREFLEQAGIGPSP